MAALTDLVDFLLDLFSNPDTREQFEQDPNGTLDDRGLDGLSGHDVRDACLLLADRGDVHRTGDSRPSTASADSVREIQYAAASYQSAPGVVYNYHTENNISFTGDVTIDDRDTIIDDRDTNIDASDDDVTVIDDSFNEDNDEVTAIDDSFNEQTEVTAINESFNSDDDTEVTTVEDSFNTEVDDSFNDDTEVTATDSLNEAGSPAQPTEQTSEVAGTAV